MKNKYFLRTTPLFFIGQCFVVLIANAAVIHDDMSGASASLNWASFGGACLTAGNGSGPIPACIGLPYYAGQNLTGGYSGKLPDPVGKGALRLTTGAPYYYQAGSVVSNFTFPSTQGLSVVFTTFTYQGATWPYNDGDGILYGSGGSGADGIGFYLLNGAVPPNIGANGGSLGYSCSNRVSNAKDGVVGGYLGLGIDEFGNFLHEKDNTATGYGYQPGRIGLRGAGSVAWSWLHQKFPVFYPGTLDSGQQAEAVRKTCETGYAWDFSNPSSPVQSGTKVMDYAVIPGAYSVLPASTKISNLSANKRGEAVPINYRLKLTQDGLLSMSYSYNGGIYQPVITNQSIKAFNGPMPSNFRFGFSGGTGGSDNIHEITCFQAGPADQSSSSAGVNVKQSGEVKTGSQVYLAFFHTDNWWGRLTAQDLTYNPSTNTVDVSAAVNWDASCVLTGGNCDTTGVTGMTAESPTNRQILTWNGLQGIPFQWSSLTTTQKLALTAGDPPPANSQRLLYLRGDRSKESNNPGGIFRQRTGVLGDIIHSSPAWGGPPLAPYTSSWNDKIYTSTAMPENSILYSQFANNLATRQNVVYIGANDGFVHGFRAGAYDVGGNFVDNSTTPNDGEEVLAYMPNEVLNAIHSTTATADFSSTQYAHSYFADATPAVGDLMYGGQWHSWLVGGLGNGGKAIYALDVTNPNIFSESNANKLVIGEWSSSTLTCVNVAGCGASLGNTFGTPVIRRLHNGGWGVIFGNGFDSSTGTAGIYVMTIDPSTGAKTFRFLNTGAGPKGGNNNGIAYVTAADLDGDHIIDYVYAGDIFGNVWRFDLTSNNPAQWAVSTFGPGAPKPLFSTPSNQPITTAVMVVSVPDAKLGLPRVLVDFGTGQNIPATLSSPEQYASGAQTLYGIWDWDMTAWNAKKSVQYAKLATAPTITASKLQSQTITNLTGNYRAVTNNPVCWSGSTNCTSGNTQFGWQVTLPESGEQVIFNPIISNGAFIVNTLVPADNSPFSCSSYLPTGWTLAISPTNGGSFSESFFGDPNSNFPNINGSPVNGIALNATGSPSVVLADKKQFMVNQTNTGDGKANQINPPAGTKGGRLNWIQLR